MRKGNNRVEISESIWHEYHVKLAVFIKSRVSEDVVDDLQQDIFIKIHSQINSLNENTKLESWLYQITRNTIIDHYRSKRRTDDLPEWVEQLKLGEYEIIREELSSCLEKGSNLCISH
jgi:RNA polymerase sigma-70 factor, ECF subfamily